MTQIGLIRSNAERHESSEMIATILVAVGETDDLP